jgi:preprotein translocase subunit SecA
MHYSAKQFYPANHAIRPERKDASRNAFERVIWELYGKISRPFVTRKQKYAGFVQGVNQYGKNLTLLTDQELRQRIQELRKSLLKQGFIDKIVAEAFALIREISSRRIGMRHYDVQIIGGWVLLNGMIAEMNTGEGKTLTAVLPAATAALAGVPVHVISVNDYLVTRDAELLKPVYNELGLTVGTVVQGMSMPERRNAYLCDITYCTNNELTFDYLKDVLTLGAKSDPLSLQAEPLYGKGARLEQLLLRGLHFAIIDEVDSVLIDEARTPLIISGGGEDASGEIKSLHDAMSLLQQLEMDDDYTLDYDRSMVELTDAGKDKLIQLTSDMGVLWKSQIRREELAKLALSATYLFRKNEHYLVRDGKVQIIDQYTGRLMPDRSWERGLHQLIEIKEECETSERRETLAKISYQRFFRRFMRLSGMTGTANEVKDELWSVYELPVTKVPTHRPVRRSYYPNRIYLTDDEKWSQVIDRVKILNQLGRPVLIGTRSVASSERASELFSNEGLIHRVLNAKQDQEEADIVSQAGQACRITIVTNMAGRGTDIKLDEEVIEKGGLHVIITELHEAGRIDRQLSGRCARQGEQGSVEMILSLEDPLFFSSGSGLYKKLVEILIARNMRLGNWLGYRLVKYAQNKLERIHFQARKDLLEYDKQLNKQLSFSGSTE